MNMKPILTALSLLALCLLAGCASPYMIDRSNDAADIFTATVDKGIGFKVRGGPFAGGLGYSFLGTGLRGGAVIDKKSDGHGHYGARDISVILFNSDSCNDDKMEVRWKEISGGSKRLPPGTQWSREFLPFIQLSNVHNPAYYTDIEFWFGFIYSIRLGINPGELLDFLLGWTTLDIYGDDIAVSPEKAQQTVYIYPVKPAEVKKIKGPLKEYFNAKGAKFFSVGHFVYDEAMHRVFMTDIPENHAIFFDLFYKDPVALKGKLISIDPLEPEKLRSDWFRKDMSDERRKAFDRGKAEARNDFSKDRYQVILFEMPYSFLPFYPMNSYLGTTYRVHESMRYGEQMQVGELEHVAGYNQVMKELLLKKFGKDIFKEAEEINKKRMKQLSEPAKKILRKLGVNLRGYFRQFKITRKGDIETITLNPPVFISSDGMAEVIKIDHKKQQYWLYQKRSGKETGPFNLKEQP